MPAQTDNTIALYLIRGALFMFYWKEGIRLFMRNKRISSKQANTYQYNKVLGCLLILWSLELLKDGISQYFPWFSNLHIRRLYLLSDLFAIPLCAFYVKTMIYKSWFTATRFILYLSPFVIFIVAYALTMSEVLYLFILGAIILYCVIVLRGIRQEVMLYNKSLRENYSYLDDIDLRWIKQVIVLFVINLIYCLYVYSDHSAKKFYLYYAYCLMMWIYIIYRNNKHVVPVYVDTPEENSVIRPDIKQSNTSIQEEVKTLWTNKLNHLFQEKHYFLRSTITMQDVATEIGTNRTYLSQYLNNTLNTTFYKYVNEFRLDYAEELLIKTDETLIAISEKSGFNSLSTFLRSFGTRHKCTPKQFRKDKKAGK